MKKYLELWECLQSVPQGSIQKNGSMLKIEKFAQNIYSQISYASVIYTLYKCTKCTALH